MGEDSRYILNPEEWNKYYRHLLASPVRLYKELGMEIEPNWYVIFRLLQKHGELTVMEIADKIGFAHPSVISIVNKMIKANYLEENKLRMLRKYQVRAIERIQEEVKNGKDRFLFAEGVFAYAIFCIATTTLCFHLKIRVELAYPVQQVQFGAPSLPETSQQAIYNFGYFAGGTHLDTATMWATGRRSARLCLVRVLRGQ